jgi:hypothetical protein
MRIAILSDDSYSYTKPMAISLSKMLNQLNVKNRIFYNGTKALNYRSEKNLFENIKEIIKIIINLFIKNRFIIPSYKDLIILKKQLKKFDVIIVCAAIPISLAKNYYNGIDLLRKYFNTPIINYDVHFWASMEGRKFIRKLNVESKWGGFCGFERFDYYLTASNISEIPVKKIFWPVSVIGANFTNKYLKPRQIKFRALIDFKRKNFLAERKMQIEILKKLNIPYTILSKKYEHSKIYKIYSKHSIYFLAHRESFGLPIVELQNCGCYIFTPYKKWAPSHYINKSIYSRGEGNLSKNFIIYNNDPLLLEKKIKKIKSNYLAKKVIYEFKKKNGNLYKGNLKILDSVIKKIKTGKINYNSHLKYKELHKHILE